MLTLAGRSKRIWVALSLATVAMAGSLAFTSAGREPEQVSMDTILRGRQLVLEYACSSCHGGAYEPGQEAWMVGYRDSRPDLEFPIGPCAITPGAEPCFRTRPRNLTPHNLTGMGRFTERQIFNSLRYGLRPGETPDVEITSMTPGEGNFPLNPKYIAPPMPWPAWRHIPDEDLWAMAAYLKHGVAPVENRVPDSEGPPDFWVESYTDLEAVNPYEIAPFPTANEVRPSDPALLEQVLHGRQVTIRHDCGACHGGFSNPAQPGWLTGVTAQNPAFPIGPCLNDPAAQPCWMMAARNLTPHATGIGGYTDRQVFNALRYGLRPSTTPDVEITSSTPGNGNFPANPDYLGLGMPWTSWRYMSDDDLHALIAYLRHGVRPADNEVMASDAPPDLWASEYTVEKIGRYPASPFPTAHEVRR